MQLLIAHGEENLIEDIRYSFDANQMTVLYCQTIQRALEYLRAGEVDFCLIGTDFRDGTGLDLKRAMSESRDAPTIVLAPDPSPTQAVLYLEYGCDDYMSFPIDLLELKARIRAVQRRYMQGKSGWDPEEAYRFTKGDFSFDLVRRVAAYREESLPLTGKEFDLLLYLAKEQGRVITREEICEEVWAEEPVRRERTIDVHIRRLRQKLLLHGAQDCIVTRWGEGYEFIEMPHPSTL